MLADINHYWLNPSWYNFMSSEFGGIAVKLVGLLIFGMFVRWLHQKVHAHLECHVEGCSAIGHPVHGTSHRACKPHHPHLDEEGHSAKEIAHAARHGHNPGGST
jgi:hypothetical protein